MRENQPLFDLYQQQNVFFSAHALSEDSLRNCSMVICTATPAESEQLRTLLTLPDLIKSGRKDFRTPTQRDICCSFWLTDSLPRLTPR